MAIDQYTDHIGVPPAAGDMQRRVAADTGAAIGIRAGVNQHFSHAGIAMFGRPVQRGHAVALGLVDVLTRTQQSTHGIEIACLGRIGNGPGKPLLTCQ